MRMRTGLRRSTVVLLAVSESDAAAEVARHPGLRVAHVLRPGAPGLEGLRVTAVYATAAATSHPAYAGTLATLRRAVAEGAELLPERVG